MRNIERALISTANKAGILEFAKQLSCLNVSIIATGNTAATLRQHGIPTTDVSEHTGSPEMLSGRVKTLHPKIHAGILARNGVDDDELQLHNIPRIDLVVVNLYPFEETIRRIDTSFDDSIEQIDIGGPTMLRAAAKNHRNVTVVVDPKDYDCILREISENGNTTEQTRQRLALKVFQHTSHYDGIIAAHFEQHFGDMRPLQPPHPLQHKQQLRYGENPHQMADLYSLRQINSLAEAKCIQGKPLSYNNLIDADAALSCIRGWHDRNAICAIIKHATPCGVAVDSHLNVAYQKAVGCDSTSAFGGIVAVNQTLDEETALAMSHQFIEVIVAPGISDTAKAILSEKTQCRIIIMPIESNNETTQIKSIDGGVLIQSQDKNTIEITQCQCPTKKQPSESEIDDLRLAWHVVRQVKSNAIVYVKNNQAVGIGTGQTSRIFSAKIAAQKAEDAGLDLQGASMASDAFFPFPDSIELAARFGIKSVIQPGGSKRDQEVIDAANENGLSMIFTGMRHFKH